MSTSSNPLALPVRRIIPNDFLELALRCAGNVFGAIDRPMPEAWALAAWLNQYHTVFNLTEANLVDEVTLDHGKRRGISGEDWYKVGTGLAQAEAFLPARLDVPVDRWIASVTDSVALDPLDAEIFSRDLSRQVDHDTAGDRI